MHVPRPAFLCGTHAWSAWVRAVKHPLPQPWLAAEPCTARPLALGEKPTALRRQVPAEPSPLQNQVNPLKECFMSHGIWLRWVGFPLNTRADITQCLCRGTGRGPEQSGSCAQEPGRCPLRSSAELEPPNPQAWALRQAIFRVEAGSLGCQPFGGPDCWASSQGVSADLPTLWRRSVSSSPSLSPCKGHEDPSGSR